MSGGQGLCERLLTRAGYRFRDVSRLRLGMRWWLAGAFAGIAALTAVLTATVSSRQVHRDVQANAREIAIGQSVSAGFEIERAIPRALPRRRRCGGRGHAGPAALPHAARS